jgi:hypothetical protein
MSEMSPTKCPLSDRFYNLLHDGRISMSAGVAEQAGEFCAEIAAIEHWQNDAAETLAQFILLSAHPDESDCGLFWSDVALRATVLLNVATRKGKK